MGAFAAVAFTFIVVGLGMQAIRDGIVGVFRGKPKITESEAEIEVRADIEALILALKNEGYFGEVKAKEITYVDDEVLSSMLRELNAKYDLKWVLPHFRMRVKKTPTDAPEWFKHTLVVMTPTHAVGY